MAAMLNITGGLGNRLVAHWPRRHSVIANQWRSSVAANALVVKQTDVSDCNAKPVQNSRFAICSAFAQSLSEELSAPA
jgi:hypothetical protein